MTIKSLSSVKFVQENRRSVKQFNAIAITHKRAGLASIGQFHIDDQELESRLSYLKREAGLEELMYLSTCNRVEFYFVSETPVDTFFLSVFFHAFHPGWQPAQVSDAVAVCEFFCGEEAVRHVFNVAASLDSMVVGEREIITQVRTAYETCRQLQLTGDTIRLVMKKTVEVAKEIYTHTDIATKPVSVVSLAYRKLQELAIPDTARILFIGAGQTNTTMARFLKKHGYTRFIVFNRSAERAAALATELDCEGHTLDRLASYQGGFDVLVTCTASSGALVTPTLYETLLQGDTQPKVVVDMAVPGDLDRTLPDLYKIKLIDVEHLKAEAETNLREREKELEHCNALVDRFLAEFRDLYRVRQVERAMSRVPQEVKAIRHTALHNVFAKELETLDPDSREVLDKVIGYMEKKYISVPMKMAREILLENKQKDPVS